MKNISLRFNNKNKINTDSDKSAKQIDKLLP